MVQQYQGELDKIPDEILERLLARSRSQVVEMGKPLIRTASRLQITGPTRGRKFVDLNRRSVEELSGNAVDPLPSTLVGSIVRYDKENGWGKFRNKEFRSPISFVVPAAHKNDLKWDVIEAMKDDEVEIVFYYVRDQRGVVKYLIFENIID